MHDTCTFYSQMHACTEHMVLWLYFDVLHWFIIIPIEFYYILTVTFDLSHKRLANMITPALASRANDHPYVKITGFFLWPRLQRDQLIEFYILFRHVLHMYPSILIPKTCSIMSL
jgi:hypothetical protein